MSKRRIEPGVGGTDSRGVSTIGEVEMQRRGWIPIPHSAVPEGMSPTGEYVTAYPARGGSYHCAAWERPQAIGSRALSDRVDREMFDRWRRWLLAEGIVPPIHDGVRSQIEARDAQRAAREAEEPEPAAKSKKRAEKA